MSESFTPEVLWAQRSSVADAAKNYVYLTISVPDIPKDKFELKLDETTLNFSGYSNSLKRQYKIEIEFYASIDPDESKINHTDKNVELKLQKKELKEEYWPRLLKESKKLHFLKTDFDKWVDEDEQNEAAEEDFNNFGGMGGMPGMGGDFGGIDFSKLGGGGMDLSGMGGDGGADVEDAEEDEDLPDLEDENEHKIEEVTETETKA